MSGIYFFAGWKCAQGALSGRIDGGAAFPLADLIDRPDTASVCNDTNNGWIAQYNYNRLSEGIHTFEAFDCAASFATVTFQVVHSGEEFKTGVTGSGTSSLSDGSTATLTWRQSLQAFVVTEATPCSGNAEGAICTTKTATVLNYGDWGDPATWVVTNNCDGTSLNIDITPTTEDGFYASLLDLEIVQSGVQYDWDFFSWKDQNTGSGVQATIFFGLTKPTTLIMNTASPFFSQPFSLYYSDTLIFTFP